MTESAPSPDALAADHVVVGASDPAATVAFFEALGLSVLERRELAADAAAELHGIEGGTEEVLLGVPGRPTGGIRVVATPHPKADRDPFFRGGHAVDFYTTDMQGSVDAAKASGAVVGPVADYKFGPVDLQQMMAIGPDGVDVVFVGISHRLPTVLEDEPTRLHSEVHSVVASVDDIAAETAFWTETAGLDLKSQFPIDVPEVSEFMMLPRHAPLKMTVMTGPGALPPRFELLGYDEAEGALSPSRPLTAGSIVPVFTVGALDAFVDRLVAAGATAGQPVSAGGTRARWVRSPGGVDVELRERVS